LNARAPDSGARVRVFLPTYRRRSLLPRAVASLRAQTFAGWICELHNDDPHDPFPGELVNSLADPRIRLVQHARNLGPIAIFNLFHEPAAEPFQALLEDDNTWEPAFLETLLAALASHPQCTVAWCNQRIVREAEDGSIQETGTWVRPPEAGVTSRLQPWGDPAQIMGALHANGAMVLRSRAATRYPTPAIPFGCVEAFRERLFPHPLVYVPQPLATFTVTRQTARRHDTATWGAAQAMLAATYLKHARLSPAAFAALCMRARAQKPPTTNTLFLATFLDPELRFLRRAFSTLDRCRLLKNTLRHPLNTWRTLRARSRHPDWWTHLDRHTEERFREAGSSAELN
jgi:hypothetical protein